MQSLLDWHVFLSHLKPFTGNFCDIAHSYKLFTYQYFRYHHFLFLSKSFRHLLLAFTYRWIAWHILTPVSFPTINNKIVNGDTIDHYPSRSELTSTIHPHIFLWTPLDFISPEKVFPKAEGGTIMELEEWPKLNLQEYWSKVLKNSTILAHSTILVSVLCALI